MASSIRRFINMHLFRLGHTFGVRCAVARSLCTATTSTHTMAEANYNTEQEELDKLYRRVQVEVRGNDVAVLKSYSWFATAAAKELGIKVGECWAPRKANHNRFTLLKSVHIYKKHRVQYEIRTYFRFMEFLELTGSTADTFLEYIQRNLPEGVAMKVTREAIQQVPDHIKPPPQNS